MSSQPAARQTRAWRFPHRRPSVLVAHANPSLRAEIEAALEQDGYRIVTADSRDAVVRALGRLLLDRGGRLDLLIVDRALLGWSAHDLLEELRGTDRAVPLVVLAADGSRGQPSVAHAYHAVFRVPFDMDDLRTAALNLVSPPSARQGSGIYATPKSSGVSE